VEVNMSADTVGAFLRTARRRRGWSLAEAASRSGNEFKASTLGAYERGDRPISVSSVERLAELYGMTLEELLTRRPQADIDLVALADMERGGILLDLSRLRSAADERAVRVMAFATAIKALRSEATSSVIVVRRSDAAFIASLVGCDPMAVDRELQGAVAWT
jgi:transcriptional regulator with XRE-family HTH domain